MADMDYNYSGDVVSGVEPAKKHTGAVIGGVTAGVLAVAVGGGIAAYNMSDLVKNQVKLTISKPDEYYSWVLEKNSNEAASQISEAYREYIEEYKNGLSYDLKLKYDISDDAKALLDEETDNMLPDFNSVTLGVTSVIKDNILSADIFAEVNDKNVISTEMAADYSAYDVFFRLPGLSEQWIMSSSVLDETELEELNARATNPEEIITPEELETLIVKYTNLFSECVSDIELEKKEEIAISDITVKYTVAEMTVTEAKANEIAEKFINEIKNDSLIREIVVDRTKLATAEDYDAGLDEALNSLSEETSDEAVTIKTYIDATGSVRGISATEDEAEGESMRLIYGKQESEIRGEFVTVEYDTDAETRMDIALSEKSKNSYDGTITVLAEDEEAVVNLDNITVVNEKKGYVSGNISFEVEEQAYNLALTADENSQTVSTDIVVEGVNYGKITATLSVGSGEAPSLPDKSAAYDIYSEDADFPSDYVEQEKMVEFAKEVLMNVGLDEAAADELAVEFGDSIYYTYDAWEDDYDYGWDDEDFDFDEEYYDWDEDEFIDDSDIYWDEDFSDDMDIYWDEDFDIDMDDVEIPEINLDDIELS